MFVPEELETLAELFHKKKKPLYIVGGYVRSHIMGLGYEEDIDICSSMLPKDVLKLLAATDYKARVMNETTGVVEIEINGLRFEHATFRKESYAVKGEHLPCDVEFIENLAEDAQRRDFTSNSVYYDIYSTEIIDPLGGVQDIQNKVLRSTIEPRYLFVNDSERILRMVRIACNCGFSIDEKTYQAAAANVQRLKYLSAARKRKEIDRMLLADIKYPSLNLIGAQVRAINLLYDIGALKYLFPSLEKAISANFKMPIGSLATDYFSFLLLESTPNVRMAALLAICGTDGYVKDGVVAKGFSTESAQESYEQLRALEYSNKYIRSVCACVKNFEKLAYDKMSLKDARCFVIENEDVVADMVDFALCTRSAHVGRKIQNTRSIENIILAKTQKENKLFASNKNQVNISNEDLLQIKNISAEQCSKIKEELLYIGAKKGDILSKNQNIRLAKKLIKSIQ